MNGFSDSGSIFRLLVLGGAFLLVAACARVTPEDLGTELDQVREEMREGDEAVEARLTQQVDEVERRLEGRISSLEAELAQLQDEFHTTVERLETALRFNTPIHFAFDDATIQPEYEPVLDRFAEVIRAYYGDAVITVEGFTDPAGPAEYNRRLGERRAQAVKEYLTNHGGLSPDRVRTMSFGEAPERQVVPGARGPGEEGWQNRRVALVIDFGSAARGAAGTAWDRDDGER